MPTTTVTGYTAAKMAALADENVVGGGVVGSNLILQQRGGGSINAGSVVGPPGPAGPTGATGSGAPTIVTSTTRPGSPTLGQLIYETDTFRSYMWDGTIWRWQSGNPPSVRLKGIANQSIPAGAFTPIAFGTGTEVYDTDGLHDPVTGNTKITIPAGWGGLWDIGGGIQWDLAASGVRGFLMSLNGNVAAAGRLLGVDANHVDYGGVGGSMLLSGEARLVPGDYIELQVIHSATGAVNILGLGAGSNTFPPIFWATFKQRFN